MRRLSCFAVCLILLVASEASSSVSLAAGSTKSGASCKPKGTVKKYKGSTFICTKVGKRLLWKLKPASPTSPIPTEAPIPPVIVPPWQLLADQVWADMKKSETQTTDLTLLVSPHVDNALARRMKFHLEESLKYWSLQGIQFPPGHKLALFSEVDKDWLPTILPAGTNIYTCAADFWFSPTWERSLDGGQCRISDGTYMSVLMIGTKARIDSAATNFLLHALHHELAHSVQTYLMGQTFGQLQSKEPCWFVEGVPNFVGFYLNHYMSPTHLSKERESAIQGFITDAGANSARSGSRSPQEWSKAEWLDLALSTPAYGSKCRATLTPEGKTGDERVLFGYRVGFIMVEKFVQEWGITGLLQLLVQRSTSSNLEEAFYKTRGLSMNTWITDDAIPYFLHQCGTTCSNFAAATN